MTMSDIFDAPAAVVAPRAEKKGAGERGRAPARDRVTDRDPAVASRARRVKDAVVSDVANAWPIRSHAPSAYDLWQTRIPALADVPGENRALRGAWVVFNHVALAVSLLLSVPLFLLGHPARALLAAAVIAPLLLIWLV
jgi:hypothetical protein